MLFKGLKAEGKRAVVWRYVLVFSDMFLRGTKSLIRIGSGGPGKKRPADEIFSAGHRTFPSQEVKTFLNRPTWSS